MMHGPVDLGLSGQRFLLVGGAGFIGSHLIDRLLSEPRLERVTIFDNYSSGSEWHYSHHRSDPRLVVVRGDAKDLEQLRGAMDGNTTVVHLASNPDIARAITDPDVDFRDGTLITRNVVEAMRTTTAKRILYASGSGVYGDVGDVELDEDHGPLRPISTYGASKVAGEVMISAYSHMFDLTGCVFRFGNVVGARQTHGIGFDLLRKLSKDPTRIHVYGDGMQSKSYVAVEDAVDAVLLANARSEDPVSTYNVATKDHIAVADIAVLALDVMGLPQSGTTIEFAGGRGGWKGDVPLVRLKTDRIRRLGWSERWSSKDSLLRSMRAMLAEERAPSGMVGDESR